MRWGRGAGELRRLRATPSVSHLRRETAPSRGSLGSYCKDCTHRQETIDRRKSPYYMDFMVTGSLARELPRG